MKRILKISTIFLLCVQILNLNFVWAGNEDNTDKIKIVLYDVNENRRNVDVLKKEKVFVLDIFFSQKVIYMCSGQILNKNCTFGEAIKDNNIIVAIPYNYYYARKYIKMFGGGGLRYNFYNYFSCFFCEVMESDEEDLDGCVMQEECNSKLYTDSLQTNLSALEKRWDTNISEHDTPTVIPEKPDSISTAPLPIFWPESLNYLSET